MEIEPLIKQLLTELGENPEREGLVRTPHRVAEAWKFLTRGYTQDIDKVINGALFKADAQHLVICKDIEIYSVCEHHMLPFFGRCHIGYIPRDKVIGVSKLARIADMFSRRLQIQERLTEQIAQCLMTHLNPLGVGVVIEARHLCMMMRGVEKQNSNMISSALLGCFQTPATRAEFFQLIERPTHHT